MYLLPELKVKLGRIIWPLATQTMIQIYSMGITLEMLEVQDPRPTESEFAFYQHPKGFKCTLKFKRH